MLFFFKPKTLIVDCFTDRQELFNYAKIDRGGRFFPDWWKALPKIPANVDARNMRYCPGIVDFYRSGIVMPMWCDLNISVGKQGDPSYSWQYADRRSVVETHPPEQWGDFLDPNKYQHMKLASPWRIKTNRDVPFLFTQPVWNTNTPEEFILFNGVTNFYYQNTTSVNIIVPKTAEVKDIFIPFRKPLLMLLPMTEAKIEIKNHLVSTEELQKIRNDNSGASCTFNRSYYVIKNLMKDKTKGK